jgi:hypothetical protein
VTEPVNAQHRLFTLLAMLPWQHAADRLFPPDALRRLWLRVDADSQPKPGAVVDDRWMPLTNVASEFGRCIAADGAIRPEAVFILAMRVLDTFEPLDVDLIRAIGNLLPVNTAGRLWLEDVTATAWHIVSSVHGTQRLAEMQHDVQ